MFQCFQCAKIFLCVNSVSFPMIPIFSRLSETSDCSTSLHWTVECVCMHACVCMCVRALKIRDVCRRPCLIKQMLFCSLFCRHPVASLPASNVFYGELWRSRQARTGTLLRFNHPGAHVAKWLQILAAWRLNPPKLPEHRKVQSITHKSDAVLIILAFYEPVL